MYELIGTNSQVSNLNHELHVCCIECKILNHVCLYWMLTQLKCMWNRGGTIHYLADPICITIHDTGSNTYHDTLLFRTDDAWQGVSECFFVFWCCISFEYHRFYKLLLSCWCFLHHSLRHKWVCQSTPIPLTFFQLAL